MDEEGDPLFRSWLVLELLISLLDPIFESFGISETDDLDDPTPILVGIIVFGAAMTAVVVALLRYLTLEKSQ